MAAFWSLEKSGENEIYLSINGGRAVSIENGEDLGALRFIDYGRTSTELWLHFHGTKNGRRLDRTKFRSQEGFLEELDTSDSNAIFVKTLSKLGIGQKKTKRKNTPNTISNAMPNPLYANMMAITSSQSEELDFVKNKLVGQYEISTMRLQQAPQEFRCRELEDSWVDCIKSSMLQAPGGTVTIVPALLDPAEISNPDDFASERLEAYRIFLLGGNHLVLACRKLIEEEPDNDLLSEYRTIKVDLYCGLSPEEAKMVGNLHNQRTTSKRMFFQDEVEQIRQIYTSCQGNANEDWQEVAFKVLKKLSSETKKESLRVLFSTASSDNEVFGEVTRIFRIWRSENPQMSINQRLFKAIMSIPKEMALCYLRKIATSKDVGVMCALVEKEKKRSLMKEIFVERTGCKDWEEAEEVYEEYTEQIDQFLKLNINRKTVPTEFIRYCDTAKERRPLEGVDVQVDFTVQVNDSYRDLMSNSKIQSIIASTKRKLSIHLEAALKKLKTEE